jgi:hypothetical protein
MITLNDLYRDINSFFGEKGVNEQEIYRLDTTNVINRLIATLRVEYIQNGLGDEFIEPQTISSFTIDTDYPFLKSADLPKPILRSLPLAMSAKQSMFAKTANTLTTTTASWNQGDLVKKADKLYVATEDIPSSNTFALTFEAKNVRVWTEGLNYIKGDIVFEGGSYYRADSNTTKSTGQSITSAPFTKVVWRFVGDAYNQGTSIPFRRLFETKLHSTIYSHHPFSVKDDKVYTPLDTSQMVFYYIPEWEYVEDQDEELNIPDSMITPLKDGAIASLAQKLGINVGG